MEHRGFTYDSTSCLACGACQVACQTTHGLLPQEFFRRVMIARSLTGQAMPYSGGCNHCERPACAAACPTGAMYRDEARGVVLHDDGLCIGCGCCVWSCPYGAVSLRLTRGVSQKCDSCIERRESGLEPACVAACSMKALRWNEGEEPPEREGWKPLEAPWLPDPKQTGPSTRARFLQGEA